MMEFLQDPIQVGIAIAALAVIIGLFVKGIIVPGVVYERERQRVDKLEAIVEGLPGALSEIRHGMAAQNDRHKQLTEILTAMIQR